MGILENNENGVLPPGSDLTLCVSRENGFASEQYDVFYFADSAGDHIGGCFLSESDAANWADSMHYSYGPCVVRKLDWLNPDIMRRHIVF